MPVVFSGSNSLHEIPWGKTLSGPSCRHRRIFGIQKRNTQPNPTSVSALDVPETPSGPERSPVLLVSEIRLLPICRCDEQTVTGNLTSTVEQSKSQAG